MTTWTCPNSVAYSQCNGRLEAAIDLPSISEIVPLLDLFQGFWPFYVFVVGGKISHETKSLCMICLHWLKFNSIWSRLFAEPLCANQFGKRCRISIIWIREIPSRFSPSQTIGMFFRVAVGDMNFCIKLSSGGQEQHAGSMRAHTLSLLWLPQQLDEIPVTLSTILYGNDIADRISKWHRASSAYTVKRHRAKTAVLKAHQCKLIESGTIICHS